MSINNVITEAQSMVVDNVDWTEYEQQLIGATLSAQQGLIQNCLFALIQRVCKIDIMQTLPKINKSAISKYSAL